LEAIYKGFKKGVYLSAIFTSMFRIQ